MPATVLLTGFGPFGAVVSNPTAGAAHALARDAACRKEGVRTGVLPVHRQAAPRALRELLARHRPAALVMTGVAVGRSALCVERIGINCWRRPGDAGPGRPIVAGGPDGLFATITAETCLRAFARAGTPAAVSFTAGTYACNLVLYLALHWLGLGRHGVPPLVAFIHVPPAGDTLAPSAAAAPTLPLAATRQALRTLALELGAGAR